MYRYSGAGLHREKRTLEGLFLEKQIQLIYAEIMIFELIDKIN